MKHRYLKSFALLALSLAAVAAQAQTYPVAINAANFPDANFRSYVSSNIDTDGNGKLTEAECNSVRIIDCHGVGVTNLKGVEYFTTLTNLRCYSNQLTSLDVSKNTALKELHCSSNQLTSLDVSKNTALQQLQCNSNQLTSLDVSKNAALQNLYCGDNELTSLDVSKNIKLSFLHCPINKLISLDITGCPNLGYLSCLKNYLTSLDVTKCTILDRLDCYYNYLTSLDVSKCTNLTTFNCSNNRLAAIDLSANAKLASVKLSSQYPLSEVSLSANRTSILLPVPGLNKTKVSNMTHRGENIDCDIVTYAGESAIELVKEGTAVDFNATSTASPTLQYTFSPQYADGVAEKVSSAKMDVLLKFPPFHAMYINPAAYSQTYKAYIGTLYLDVLTVIPQDATQRVRTATGITVSNEQTGVLTTNLTPSKALPAKTGVIVTASKPYYHIFEGSVTFDFYERNNPYVYNPSPDPWDSILKGTSSTYGKTVPYGQVLTLGRRRDDGSGTVGFWTYAGTKISPYRCYIDTDDIPSLQASSAARFVGLALLFDEDEDGAALQTGLDTAPIAPATDAAAPAVYYDLQGRRVDQPRKGGVYIVGGRKVLMK